MDMLPPWMRPRPRRPPPSEVYLRAMAQEDDLPDDLQGKFSLINFYCFCTSPPLAVDILVYIKVLKSVKNIFCRC